MKLPHKHDSKINAWTAVEDTTYSDLPYYGIRSETTGWVVPPARMPKRDALVMAAAPELLDALQDLVLICDDSACSHPAIDKARAAISKATGGKK